MTDEAILQRFRDIRTWTRRDERAPHKPLLLLLSLANIQLGRGRLLAYAEVEPKLTGCWPSSARPGSERIRSIRSGGSRAMGSGWFRRRTPSDPS